MQKNVPEAVQAESKYENVQLINSNDTQLTALAVRKPTLR